MFVRRLLIYTAVLLTTACLYLVEETYKSLSEIRDLKSDSLVINERMAENLALLEQEKKALDKALKAIPTGVPADGKVLSAFGYRKSSHLRSTRLHKGIDIDAAIGTEVVATADGIVTRSERDSEYGKVVEIDHLNGFRTRYAHNSKTFVKLNETVKQNQRIALSGATGRVTAPHIHYETWYKNKVIDPSKLVQF